MSACRWVYASSAHAPEGTDAYVNGGRASRSYARGLGQKGAFESSSAANSVSSAKNSVSSLWHRHKGWEELTEFSPRNSVRAKNSLSSGFETVLSETIFGPSPSNCNSLRIVNYYANEPRNHSLSPCFSLHLVVSLTYYVQDMHVYIYIYRYEMEPQSLLNFEARLPVALRSGLIGLDWGWSAPKRPWCALTRLKSAWFSHHNHPAEVQSEFFLRFSLPRVSWSLPWIFGHIFLRVTFSRICVSELESFTQISRQKQREKRKFSAKFLFVGGWHWDFKLQRLQNANATKSQTLAFINRNV